MESYFMAGMIIFIGGLYVWEKKENKDERADLIARIMAKHLPDYSKHVMAITEENKELSIEDAIAKMQKDDRLPIT